jgi:hypothetical protein
MRDQLTQISEDKRIYIMNKGTLLAATLLLASGPAFAQGVPAGNIDGTLGNGNVESQAPWLSESPAPMQPRSRYYGPVERRMGGGGPDSQALWVDEPVSTGSIGPGRTNGGIDGSYGNGNVYSQAPWLR